MEQAQIELVAVVVAKTRMGRQICIGAAVYDAGGAIRPGTPLRLLPVEGNGWPEERFQFRVGDKIRLIGSWRPHRLLPHTEDFDVVRTSIRLETRITPERYEAFVNWVRQHCVVWQGYPSGLFEGCLERSERGSKWSVAMSGHLPSMSVGFWKLPQKLYRDEWGEDNITYGSVGKDGFDFRVKYVGLNDEHPAMLSAGTLVRLSLARPWIKSPETIHRCWLQLSGWY